MQHDRPTFDGTDRGHHVPVEPVVGTSARQGTSRTTILFVLLAFVVLLVAVASLTTALLWGRSSDGGTAAGDRVDSDASEEEATVADANANANADADANGDESGDSSPTSDSSTSVSAQGEEPTTTLRTPTLPEPTPASSIVPETTLPTVSLPIPEIHVGNVARSCGSSGRGDCFVSLRDAPTSSSGEMQRIPEGTPVRVLCQVLGEPVKGSVLARSTEVWIKDESGGFMSAAFVDVPGWSPFEISTPCG